MDDLAIITKSIEEIGAAAKTKGVEIDKQIADMTTSTKALNQRVLDLEQKLLTRRPGGGPRGEGGIDIGALVTKDAKFQDLLKGNAQRISIPINQGLRAICKSILGNAGSTGVSPAFEFPVTPDVVPGIYGFAGRRLSILDALPVIPVSSAESVVYKLDSFDDASARQQHEGDEKAESKFQFGGVPQRHATVAHFVNVSKQLLNDADMVLPYLNNVMLYLVRRKLETLLVSGDGGATDGIAGLVTQGTIFHSSEDQAVDRLGQSAASLISLGFSANLILLNAFDYQGIIAARDANGRFIGPGWGAPIPNSLWGVTAIPSAALTTGTAIVMDSTQVAVLDREQANISLGYTGNQFAENAATVLAELRASLAVFNSNAVNVVSLPADSTA